MATTTFSGPVKAGTIKDTTGTTVGTDVANIGYTLMAQSAVIDIIGTSVNTTVGILPPNSQVVNCILNITTANDDTNAASVTVGVNGNTNAFLTSTSAKSIGLTQSTAIELIGTDVGANGVAVVAYFTATDGDGTNGAATVTVLYVQDNNLL
jgi:hypothetical protein